MSTRDFRQVDVFTTEALLGNPLAVVHGADGLSDDRMRAIARWTNLSETSFLLAPTDPAADYRLRIFTPAAELPFAGHPTLGSAHAWLEADGVPAGERVVQQCGVGLVELRRAEGRLAFAAPPLTQAPVTDAEIATVARALRIAPDDVVEARRLVNGPHFVGVRLRDAAAVLALQPDWSAFEGLEVGVVGLHEPGGESALEVRVFGPDLGFTEDPVTGSFNAAAAQWLTGAGTLPPSYVAAQGTAIGRRGRIHVDTDADGTIWVGGDTRTTVHGTLSL
ncbi:PhzF family phenazine biosynthesis protein [Nocardioides nitrophenolicus]|uniref:PhzF family phenazine biosynthesis protein n=1 Tax=Nocardioides nitrophenolicus TaxID=60489 RepID=UPI001956BD0B|nr:PhzF family phenazine biosynthesis protein [Nocardioides nitrophenolicus]MBM7520078.1 PhzF family phenazine biosynthesis protein [Nocardioides nitrophenolicus]